MRVSRVLVLLALCAGIVRADVVVRDDAGKDVHLPTPANRIVSLAPHITEDLFAIGAGNRIVGTVDFSDYPPAAKKIARIGGFERFDLEAILALPRRRPDGVHDPTQSQRGCALRP